MNLPMTPASTAGFTPKRSAIGPTMAATTPELPPWQGIQDAVEPEQDGRPIY
jgi:hypothetical protein